MENLTGRKMLSRMMPPRYTWVTPKKREVLPNGSVDRSKNAEKALRLTIKRDRDLQQKGEAFPYLDELDAYISKIRQRLLANDLTLESPILMPMFKKKKEQENGMQKVTCRPLSIYSQLDNKIILALTSRYLTKNFDRFLHSNILSYRKVRKFDDTYRVPDFNDGIRLIREYHKVHRLHTIYASDCDIKKFYDIIPHPVVRQCFQRLFDRSNLNDEGKAQVMRVIEAYLKSYNFYDNVWQEAANHPEIFDKIRQKFHDTDNKNHYQFEWVDELFDLPEAERRQRGVAQGGSLSLLIANIVLNDVDQAIIQHEDTQRLFIRYCDDMILLHTDYGECCRLMDCYTQSLKAHGLYYHDFASVRETKNVTSTTSQFWGIKSHYPFLWGDGEGDSNRYIGFLGYEIRRDGRMRLRKDNMKRFQEKFKRAYYAVRRKRKNNEKGERQLTQEELAQYQQQQFDKVLAGLGFYQAFDLNLFKCGSQYRSLQKLRKRIEKRLS